MMDKPRVSVVLTTFRRQDVLPRAVRSVLAQTLTNWELLVVDDEPSADTRRIVEGVGDSRVRYIPHDRNQGLCAARNTGLGAARANLIAFLDDDDEFLPEKLERQAELLEGLPHRVGVASCFEEVQRPSGDRVQRRIVLDGDVHEQLVWNDLVRMQLLMVRRACFAEVGDFDIRLPMHDDYDMTLRLARRFHFATVGESLVRIILTPASMSESTSARIRALGILMRTHPEFADDKVQARWLRRLARHHADAGDRSAWKASLRRSLRADPLNTATWITLLAGQLLGPHRTRSLGRLRGLATRALRERVHR
ncbi:MAG: glycosyltransferase [Acidobacteria bacterium]|nr:glycosyltransferase [Acidobacteriota bacterium]